MAAIQTFITKIPLGLSVSPSVGLDPTMRDIFLLYHYLYLLKEICTLSFPQNIFK